MLGEEIQVPGHLKSDPAFYSLHKVTVYISVDFWSSALTSWQWWRCVTNYTDTEWLVEVESTARLCLCIAGSFSVCCGQRRIDSQLCKEKLTLDVDVGP